MKSHLIPVFILIPVVALSLAACESQSPGRATKPDYFDMDSLLDLQVKELVMLNPEVEKSGVLDNEEETVNVHLDSLGWENELKVFRDANIDKAAYRGYYSFTAANNDPYSNLLYDEYLCIVDENVPVKRLRVFYLDTKDATKQIEILFTDRNELFDSERYLHMSFEDTKKGIPLLSTYMVTGSQKLALNDSVTYRMTGRLTY